MKKLILLTALTLGITGSMHASSLAAQALLKTALTAGALGTCKLGYNFLSSITKEAPTAARIVLAEAPQTLVLESSKIKDFVTLACLIAGAVVGIRYVYELGKPTDTNPNLTELQGSSDC